MTAPAFYLEEPIDSISHEDVSIPVPHAFIKSVLIEDTRGKHRLWTFEMRNKKLSGDLSDYLVPTTHAENIVGGTEFEPPHALATSATKSASATNRVFIPISDPFE